MLLAELPDEATFHRRLRGIHLSDSIQGPLAVQWMLSTLARAMPPGKDQILVLQQMAIVTAELRLMRRLKAGWSEFGVDHPWDAVPPQQEAWLPRYHSEPILPNNKR